MALSRYLEVKVDTGNAKRELADLAKQLKDIDGQFKGLPGRGDNPFQPVIDGSGRAMRSLDNYGGALSNLDRTLLKVQNSTTKQESALLKYDTALRKIQQAVDKGLIAQNDMDGALKRATASYDEQTAAINQGGRALINYQGELSNADRILAQTGIQTSNVSRVTLQYDTAIRSLNQALDRGQITQSQYNAALARTQADMQQAVAEARKMDEGFKGAFGGATQTAGQLGLQMQDIIVQAQMGTSAAIIIAQQGPQIASAFGPIGAIVGVVVALAAVTGGALYTALNGVTKTVQDLADESRELDNSFTLAKDGAISLTESLVDLNEQNGALAQAELGQAFATSLGIAAASAKTIKDEIEGLTELSGDWFELRDVEDIGAVAEIIGKLGDEFGKLPSQGLNLGGTGIDQGEYAEAILAVRTLGEAFGIENFKDAEGLAGILGNINLDSSIEQLEGFQDELNALTVQTIKNTDADDKQGIALLNNIPKWQQIIQGLIKAKRFAEDYEQVQGRLNSELDKFSRKDTDVELALLTSDDAGVDVYKEIIAQENELTKIYKTNGKLSQEQLQSKLDDNVLSIIKSEIDSNNNLADSYDLINRLIELGGEKLRGLEGELRAYANSTAFDALSEKYDNILTKQEADIAGTEQSARAKAKVSAEQKIYNEAQSKGVKDTAETAEAWALVEQTIGRSSANIDKLYDQKFLTQTNNTLRSLEAQVAAIGMSALEAEKLAAAEKIRANAVKNGFKDQAKINQLIVDSNSLLEARASSNYTKSLDDQIVKLSQQYALVGLQGQALSDMQFTFKVLDDERKTGVTLTQEQADKLQQIKVIQDEIAKKKFSVEYAKENKELKEQLELIGKSSLERDKVIAKRKLEQKFADGAISSEKELKRLIAERQGLIKSNAIQESITAQEQEIKNLENQNELIGKQGMERLEILHTQELQNLKDEYGNDLTAEQIKNLETINKLKKEGLETSTFASLADVNEGIREETGQIGFTGFGLEAKKAYDEIAKKLKGFENSEKKITAEYEKRKDVLRDQAFIQSFDTLASDISSAAADGLTSGEAEDAAKRFAVSTGNILFTELGDSLAKNFEGISDEMGSTIGSVGAQVFSQALQGNEGGAIGSAIGAGIALAIPGIGAAGVAVGSSIGAAIGGLLGDTPTKFKASLGTVDAALLDTNTIAQRVASEGLTSVAAEFGRTENEIKRIINDGGFFEHQEAIKSNADTVFGAAGFINEGTVRLQRAGESGKEWVEPILESLEAYDKIVASIADSDSQLQSMTDSVRGLTESTGDASRAVEFLFVDRAVAAIEAAGFAIDDSFKSLSTETFIERTEQAVASFNLLSDAADSVGIQFDRASADAFMFADELAQLSGGFENLATNLNTFIKEFKNEEEQFEFLTKGLTKTFDKIGKEIPKTRDAFVDMLESLTDPSDISAIYNSITAIDAYYDKLEENAFSLRNYQGFVQTDIQFGTSELNRSIDSLNQFAEAYVSIGGTIDDGIPTLQEFNNTVTSIASSLSNEDIKIANKAAEELSNYYDILEQRTSDIESAVGNTEASAQAAVDLYQGIADGLSDALKTAESNLNPFNQYIDEFFDGVIPSNELFIETANAFKENNDLLPETIDLIDDFGAAVGSYNALLSQSKDANKDLSDVMDQQNVVMDELNKKREEENNRIKDQIAAQRLGLQKQILALEGRTLELRQIEIDELFEVNRGLQARIWQLEDEAEALSNLNEIEAGFSKIGITFENLMLDMSESVDQTWKTTISSIAAPSEKTIDIAWIDGEIGKLEDYMQALQNASLPRFFDYAQDISFDDIDKTNKVLLAAHEASSAEAYAQWLEKQVDATEVRIQKLESSKLPQAITDTVEEGLSEAAYNVKANYASGFAAEMQEALASILDIDLSEVGGAVSDITDKYAQAAFTQKELAEISVANAEKALMPFYELDGVFEGQSIGGFRTAFEATKDSLSPEELAQWIAAAGAISDLTLATEELNDIIDGDLNKSIDNLKNSYNDALKVLEDAIDKEKDLLKEQYELDKELIEERIDNISDTISGLEDVARSLENAIKQVKTESFALDEARLRSARALISAQAAIGEIPGSGELDFAIGAVTQDTKRFYGSFDDYIRDQVKTAQDLKELKGITDDELTEQERLLQVEKDSLELLTKNYNDEIERLDGILEYYKNQYNALLGIESSIKTIPEAVLSVEAAIAGLASSMSQPVPDFSDSPVGTTGSGSGSSGSGGGSTMTAGEAALALAAQHGVNVANPDAILNMSAGELKSLGSTASQSSSTNQSFYEALSNLPGYQSGGYTGSGLDNEIAGFVHKNEVVFDAASVRHYGAENLERMRASGKAISDESMSYAEIVNAVNMLRAMMASGMKINNQELIKMRKLLENLDQWNTEGMPPERTV